MWFGSAVTTCCVPGWLCPVWRTERTEHLRTHPMCQPSENAALALALPASRKSASVTIRRLSGVKFEILNVLSLLVQDTVFTSKLHCACSDFQSDIFFILKKNVERLCLPPLSRWQPLGIRLLL